MNVDARAPRLVVLAREVQAAVAHVPAGLEVDERHIAVIVANGQDFLSANTRGVEQQRVETK